MKSNQTLLIIGKVWPEPDSSAAGSRMMQLIELLKSEGWEITFACAAADSAYSTDLESQCIKVVRVKLNNSTFDRFVSELNPAIVLFDRFMTEEQFGWRIAEHCPDAMRILDTEDLHCLRTARQKAWKAGTSFNTEMLAEEESAKREIASIYRCDLSIIISEAEMELLRNYFQIDESLLCYLPFLLEPYQKDDLPSYDERAGFVSIGNFLHEPNWNAVLWLKEEIWPRIRQKLPGAELSVYGSYPSQKVYRLNKPEQGFLVKGRTEDAKQVLREARVLLAPIRFGAGLKGKLVDAMNCGTPSVTTSVGAEGMAGKLEWSGLIKEDASSIADAAVRLYNNRNLWDKSHRNGFEILNRRFNKHDFSNLFIEQLNGLRSDLPAHRKKNFTGAMLMHHTTASTKYLAKWIEEKKR
jgi:O-antigen biosynthesis protein